MLDVELTKKVCAILGGIDGWRWSETGEGYGPDVVCVFYGDIPASPDRAIGVRLYGGVDERGADLRWRRAQVRIRGRARDKAGADTLADNVLSALHGLTTAPGVTECSRTSFTPLGADKNLREERTENYLIILDNPEASA